MSRFQSIGRLALLIPVLLAAAGCATAPDNWTASGSDRELAIVRVSYEYAKAAVPSLDSSQAAELAENRCASWGYDHAEQIPGDLRNCSVKSGDRCELWKVTREYQCLEGAAFASRLSK